MFTIFLNILLPIAINVIKNYVDSSESKQDDKILEVTKKTAEYIACKDNNTLPYEVSKEILKAVMK